MMIQEGWSERCIHKCEVLSTIKKNVSVVNNILIQEFTNLESYHVGYEPELRIFWMTLPVLSSHSNDLRRQNGTSGSGNITALLIELDRISHAE